MAMRGCLALLVLKVQKLVDVHRRLVVDLDFDLHYGPASRSQIQAIVLDVSPALAMAHPWLWLGPTRASESALVGRLVLSGL